MPIEPRFGLVFLGLGFKALLEAGRKSGFAHVAEASNLPEGQNGKQSGENRYGNSHRLALRYEIEVHLVVEKKLGGDEVGTRIYLGLEVDQVGLTVRCLGVFSG